MLYSIVYTYVPSLLNLPLPPTPSHSFRLPQSPRFKFPVSHSKFPLAIYFTYGNVYVVFPGGSEDKASACHAGDPGSIPGLGRFPGEGKDNPLQYYRYYLQGTTNGRSSSKTATSLCPWTHEFTNIRERSQGSGKKPEGSGWPAGASQ